MNSSITEESDKQKTAPLAILEYTTVVVLFGVIRDKRHHHTRCRFAEFATVREMSVDL